MWYLLEASNGKLSVLCEMREIDSLKMCKSKEGDPEVGKKTVRGFCYLGGRVNVSGGCKAAVTARAINGWVKFKECRELNSKRFLLKTKGMVYRSCIRSVMLYGSGTWCLLENEMAV